MHAFMFDYKVQTITWFFLLTCFFVLLPSAVGAASTFGNNVSVGGTATITGTTFITGTVHIGVVTNFHESRTAGDVNIGGQLAVDDQIYASSTLAVQGAIYTSSTITSDGALTASGNVTLGTDDTNSIQINADFTTGPQPNANNTYDFGAFGKAWGGLYASGTVYVGQTSSFNLGSDAGDVNIGGQLVVDDEIFASSTLTVQSTVKPYSSNQVDLGTATNGWKDIYTSGTVYIGDFTSIYSDTLGTYIESDVQASYLLFTFGGTIRGTLSNTGNLDLGTATVDGGNISITKGNQSGNPALNIILSSDANGHATFQTDAGDAIFDTAGNNVKPVNNDDIALGEYGSAWSDLFASGTVHSATSSIYNDVGTSTMYMSSGLSGVGSELILEDSDGAGCSAIMVLNGNITATTVACP